ncbi:MAG TPA: D-aminoacyl-tRNA deacylase [Thermoanaerobaculia bacterium]|nr:D-aminoacyl-tRNA deacylase [Thermoanaerobaculia bacterium]
MRCVIQRVRSASVDVGVERIAGIGTGLLLLVGIEKGDVAEAVVAAAEKILELRIFSDSAGKMNLSVADVEGSILAVSQFTLAGSLSRGRRPSFDNAEEPERARQLFDAFVARLAASGRPVQTGRFREMMVVTLENDGPVTFVYESR